MLQDSHILIISIGSNSSSEENVARAKQKVEQIFRHQIRFAPPVYTESIGLSVSSTFLNIVGIGNTDQTYEQIRSALKQLEQEMGRNKEDKHKGIVTIDIDMLQWDNKILKQADMNFPFVKESLLFLSKNAE